MEVDITDLKDKYPIKVRSRGDEKYYQVRYHLLVELDGRNLRVSVVYPQNREIRGSTQICVAACFRPGTD